MTKKKNKHKKKLSKSHKPIATVREIWWSKQKFLLITILILLTFLIFSPSLQNEFVNWDDDKNFFENPNITTLTNGNFWENTKKIFTSPVIGNYNPLTIWSFLLEHNFFGLENPFYWHLNNILLHIFCTLLVFRIAFFLDLKWQGAFILALLFGIHPMRVESVAWVTERKDVLFGFFYLLAIYYYLKNRINPTKLNLVLIMLCFCLSLLSKIQAVVLPLTFIAMDYFIDEKISFRKILSKWYYFATSLLFGILGLFFLSEQGSLSTNTTYEWWQRIFVGTYSYGVYLIKSIFPYRLSPLYPYPNNFPSIFYATIIVIPIVLLALYSSYTHKKKHLFFGIIFFTFNIMFLLQILGAGQGFIADRFTYIAFFGLFFIYAYYLEMFMQLSQFRMLGLLLVGIMTISYGYLNYNQNKVWKNSGTLWTHVLKYYQNITLPYGNRANYYRDVGKNDLALADYNETIRLKGDEPGPYNSRGRLYFNSNDPASLQLALNDYNKAIALDSNEGEYYVNRGATYAKVNKLDLAILDFNKGLELKPDHVVGYLNRSIMFAMKGDFQNQLNDIQTYLKYKPYNSDLWYESAICKRKLKRENEALSDFNKAIKYNPNKGIYYHERCKSHLVLGNETAARADYNRAVQFQTKIDPILKSKFGKN